MQYTAIRRYHSADDSKICYLGWGSNARLLKKKKIFTIFSKRNCRPQKFDKRKVLHSRHSSRFRRGPAATVSPGRHLRYVRYLQYYICYFFLSTNNFIAFQYSDLESISLMAHKFGRCTFRARAGAVDNLAVRGRVCVRLYRNLW